MIWLQRLSVPQTHHMNAESSCMWFAIAISVCSKGVEAFQLSNWTHMEVRHSMDIIVSIFVLSSLFATRQAFLVFADWYVKGKLLIANWQVRFQSIQFLKSSLGIGHLFTGCFLPLFVIIFISELTRLMHTFCNIIPNIWYCCQYLLLNLEMIHPVFCNTYNIK